MRVRLHEEARREFDLALAYFNSKDPRVAADFLRDFNWTVGRIVDHPTALAIHLGGTRRCLFETFRYGVVYLVEPREIYIVAVMYLGQRPGYWLNRL